MEFDKSRRKVSSRSFKQYLSLGSLCIAAFASPVAAWRDWQADEQAPILPFRPHQSSSHTPSSDDSSISSSHLFTLRHVVHRGTKLHPDLHRRLDINPDKVKAAALREEPDENGIGPYIASASGLLIPRMQDRRAEVINPMMMDTQTYGSPPVIPDGAWSLDEVAGPNVTDKGTVVNFALMAASAYQKDRSDSEWVDARPPFNLSSDVGWEQDGIRGHVFSNPDNSTIVISIKGTTSAVFDGAETTTNDKENDNLLGSCCCAQGGHYLWRQVCDCMTSAYTCNETCVTKNLRKPNRYYQASLELYGNITDMYPEADVWLTGHSLGGVVASLLGLTYGLPAVTYEAYPQALAAGRLSLPTPPGYASALDARKRAGLWNFGHTADPIYMGACGGATSLCTIGGYALESSCHVGLRCVYDVVEDRKWRVSLTYHSIRTCIRDVYKDYDTVPTCEPDEDCVDCFNWKRFHSNGSETTTSSSSTSSTFTTTTRTSTCKTPGWWGCRDETSTTSSPITETTTSTTTQTTETCKSYGWFGNCLDPVTTTTTSTTTIPPPTTTDAQSVSSTGSCETPGRFWGCKDISTTESVAHVITSAPELRV